MRKKLLASLMVIVLILSLFQEINFEINALDGTSDKFKDVKEIKIEKIWEPDILELTRVPSRQLFVAMVPVAGGGNGSSNQITKPQPKPHPKPITKPHPASEVVAPIPLDVTFILYSNGKEVNRLMIQHKDFKQNGQSYHAEATFTTDSKGNLLPEYINEEPVKYTVEELNNGYAVRTSEPYQIDNKWVFYNYYSLIPPEPEENIPGDPLPKEPEKKEPGKPVPPEPEKKVPNKPDEKDPNKPQTPEPKTPEPLQPYIPTPPVEEKPTVEVPLEEPKVPESIPNKPEQPETPDKPETPNEPDKPSNPETPNTPETPETPQTPNKLEEPNNPQTPEVPEDEPIPQGNPELPKTAGIPAMMIVGFGIGLLVGGMILKKRRG